MMMDQTNQQQVFANSGGGGGGTVTDYLKLSNLQSDNNNNPLITTPTIIGSTQSSIVTSSAYSLSSFSSSTYHKQLASLCHQLISYNNPLSNVTVTPSGFNTTNSSTTSNFNSHSSKVSLSSNKDKFFHWNNITKKICNEFFTQPSAVLPSSGYNFYENSVNSVYSRLPLTSASAATTPTIISTTTKSSLLSSYLNSDVVDWNNDAPFGGASSSGSGGLFDHTLDSDSAANSVISPNIRIMLIIFLSLMIVFTVIGNILVCLSVILVRKLRHPSNYLLVSLAISDLCVAILVMPLALQYELTSSWNLTNAICDLWVSFDVTCCTSSILNLCTISIDRYLAITKPLTYGVRRTTRRILSFIGAVWIGSCLISIPPVLILGNEHGTEQQPICEVSQNIGYQLYATLGAFYIPLLVMIVLYYKIYIAAKRVVDAELRDQRSSSCSKKASSSSKALLKHVANYRLNNPNYISNSKTTAKCDPTSAPSIIRNNCCCCSSSGSGGSKSNNPVSNHIESNLTATTPTPTTTGSNNSPRSGSGSYGRSSQSSSGSGSNGSSGIGKRGCNVVTCCCGSGSDKKKITTTSTTTTNASGNVMASLAPPPSTTTTKKGGSKSNKRMMSLSFTKKSSSNNKILMRMNTIPDGATMDCGGCGSGTSNCGGSNPSPTTCCDNSANCTFCCCDCSAQLRIQQNEVDPNSNQSMATLTPTTTTPTTAPGVSCCDYYHYATTATTTTTTIADINPSPTTTSHSHAHHNKQLTTTTTTTATTATTINNIHYNNGNHYCADSNSAISNNQHNHNQQNQPNLFQSSLNFLLKRGRGRCRCRGHSQNNNHCDNNNNLKNSSSASNKKNNSNNNNNKKRNTKISKENSPSCYKTNQNNNCSHLSLAIGSKRNSITSISNKRRTSNALRERKASFTLGIIMTAFTVCWLPFFILALIKPFSSSLFEFPRFVHSVALWLGYVNSMLNPIIYVTFHQDFRRAFKYLLCFQCSTMGPRLRAEAYRSQYGKSGGSDTAIGQHNTVTFASIKHHSPAAAVAASKSIAFGTKSKVSTNISNQNPTLELEQQQQQHRNAHIGSHQHHYHHHHNNHPSPSTSNESARHLPGYVGNSDSPVTPLLSPPTAPSIVVNNNHSSKSSNNDMIITTNAPILFLPTNHNSPSPSTSPPISPSLPSSLRRISGDSHSSIDCIDSVDHNNGFNSRHFEVLLQSTPTIIPTTTIDMITTTT